MTDLERTATRIDVRYRVWIERVTTYVRGKTTPGPIVVVEALADPEIWPERGDWMVVTCDDDGGARYGIAPFVAAAPVTNACDACAAIRSELPRAR